MRTRLSRWVDDAGRASPPTRDSSARMRRPEATPARRPFHLRAKLAGVPGPRSPRWTHVALPCADLGASLAWYARYTPLALLDRRDDPDGSAAAWIGHRDSADQPFILVLVQPAAPARPPRATLAPFAHLGIEMPDRAGVDAVAAQARADGCLHWEPADWGPPIGYLCAAVDPDGNVVEFSCEQGVYETAQRQWGDGT